MITNNSDDSSKSDTPNINEGPAAKSPHQMQTYTGGCHCGKVRYEVTAQLSQVFSCNCSMCQKKGTLLAFIPGDQFKLAQGAEALTDYQFNKHIIHHLFCSTCGVTSFARGKKGEEVMVAINARCVDDIDIDALNIIKIDGRNM